MNEPNRRLFFALWPSEALRQALAVRAKTLLHPFRCRPIPVENLHVTLAFLGAVPVSKVPQLEVLGRTLSINDCVVRFDRLAIWRKAGVIALTASTTPEPLIEFVTALQRALAAAGFRIEERPYQAHVTLARDVQADSVEEGIPPINWPMQEFVLVESSATATGSHYEVIAKF